MTPLSTDTFTLLPGRTPLLVSLPHCGTALPPALAARLAPHALAVPDTDWHLAELYAFAHTELGAGLLVPRYSRYVVDLNRPPDNAPMYPGANNTGLCPLQDFEGRPLYAPGTEPDEAEIAQRREQFWRPYHQALEAELSRLQAQHGHAVLFDGHSIRSRLPWLFDGRLPDLNLGTASGASCDPALRAQLAAVLAGQSHFSQVVDGRFKGGHITRHHGRPAQGRHAVQLEMAFATYLDEDAPLPPVLDATRVARLQPVLRALLTALTQWRPAT
ncbi:N-formylglutamate deformylase [Ideonella livida]|uniref:N-formylglutamate deformylase n=1 Tax=Ideonella livida TaxID=2707176 RepID=A0A7C9TKH3_9BURK|nr:N-formylglutamate deformylase [Ideonella livida]NDY91325.1 N-formylglutamate deformylase [Ideonella livida]